MATKQSALYTEPKFLCLRVLKNGEHNVRKAVTVKVLLGSQEAKLSATHHPLRVELPADMQRLSKTWQLRCPVPAQTREAVDPDMEQLLVCCTSVLGLASSARWAFTEDGQLIRHLRDLEEGQLVYVSAGGKRFVPPANHTESLAKKRLLDRAEAELQRMEHLRRLYQVGGLVLTAQEPVEAGSPVGLAPKPPPCPAVGLKGIVAVLQDKSYDRTCDKPCDKSHANRVPSATTDSNVLHTFHERSHHKADELHLSRQPSWKKSLEVQAEETIVPPSELDPRERSRLPGPAHTWAWFKDHLVLADNPVLALAVSDVMAHAGAGLCVAPYKETDLLQQWEHTQDGFLAPLHDNSLVVAVTNLTSLNDKHMSPGLVLRPKINGTWPLAHQKWVESARDADDRVSLQPFGGSEQENYLTIAQISEVCSHSVCESGPFPQLGYELVPADGSPLSHAPPTLVCGGCGRYLKKAHPQLFLREMERLEVFQCMFWRTQEGGSSLPKLSGPLQCFSGKADLSQYEVSTTLSVLGGKVRQWRAASSLEEVRRALSDLPLVVRRDVVVHQNGARGRGTVVKASTVGGLLCAASSLLSLRSPATIAYLSNGTAVVDMDQLVEGGAEVWVTSEGEEFAAPNTITEGSDQLAVWECQPDPIAPIHSSLKKWPPCPRPGLRSERRSTVSKQPKPLHFRVYSSGSSVESAQTIVAKNFNEVLEESMFRLHLTSPVKRVFTTDGKPVMSFEDLVAGQLLGVATTGRFLQEQDVNHVIARKARWSRKHRAQTPTQTYACTQEGVNSC